MKQTTFVAGLFAIAFGWCLVAPAGPAFSQDTTSRLVKFGVVDVEAIERESLMNKDITTQINALRNKLSEEVKKEEASLRKANDDLQRQKVLLAPDAFEQEVRKFRERELAFQKNMQERNDQFNRVRLNVRNAFANELNKALIDITKEQQFTLILRRSQVLTVADFLDITKYVLDRMNKNAPKYQIPSNLMQGGGQAAKGSAKSGETKKK
jgi:Skp family chaperone for outer membrane proteins